MDVTDLRFASLSWVLWFRYVSLGGSTGPVDVAAHLAGLIPLPSFEQLVLDHAIWELAVGL